MAQEKIVAERNGHIARFVINNPERRNAMSFAMWQRMGEVFEAWARDGEVRAVIVRGAGDKAFSAGNDISEFKERRSDRDSIDAYSRTTAKAYDALRLIPKPTIARIGGFCIGGGLEIAQLCDLQIAAHDARFAVTPAKLGLGYKLDDVMLLARNTTMKHAKELLMTGRMFSANEALQMGLVNRVVPAPDLDTAVDECAAMIAANAPLSVRAAKLIVHEAYKESEQQDQMLCQALVDACHASEDYQEGQKAFSEKRKPRFLGR